MLCKYFEIVKTLSLHSETVPLDELDVGKVVMSQLNSHCPRPRPRNICGSRDDGETQVGGAWSGLWKLTNQSRLDLKRQAPKRSIQTEGE